MVKSKARRLGMSEYDDPLRSPEGIGPDVRAIAHDSYAYHTDTLFHISVLYSICMVTNNTEYECAIWFSNGY